MTATESRRCIWQEYMYTAFVVRMMEVGFAVATPLRRMSKGISQGGLTGLKNNMA